MRKEKIYLDTSVISAYNDIREPEKITQTLDFINQVEGNKNVEIFISSLVKDEISQISNVTRKKELEILMNSYQGLDITNEIEQLAEVYIINKVIPDNYVDDALHLAIATVNSIDIIISWNFTHLVKLKTRHMVNALNLVNGYKEIEIIAPIEY